MHMANTLDHSANGKYTDCALCRSTHTEDTGYTLHRPHSRVFPPVLCAILIQQFNECVAHYKLDHESSRWMVQVFRSGKRMVWFVFGLLTEQNTQYFTAGLYFISSLLHTVGLPGVCASSAYCIYIWNGKNVRDNERQPARQQQPFLTPTCTMEII